MLCAQGVALSELHSLEINVQPIATAERLLQFQELPRISTEGASSRNGMGGRVVWGGGGGGHDLTPSPDWSRFHLEGRQPVVLRGGGVSYENRKKNAGDW